MEALFYAGSCGIFKGNFFGKEKGNEQTFSMDSHDSSDFNVFYRPGLFGRGWVQNPLNQYAGGLAGVDEHAGGLGQAFCPDGID